MEEKRFKVGDKVYYMNKPDDSGIVTDYNELDKLYKIEQNGTHLWTQGGAWSKEFSCYNHKWVTYDSGWTKYKYCSLCDKKDE